MTCEIREAIFDDVDAVAALLTELNREEGNDVISHADDVVWAMFGTNRAVDVGALVAVAEATIIGTLVYYPGYDTLSASYGYHLADIVVSKAYRGHGIGRALVKALAKMARDTHKDWVSLTVLKKNDAALKFYESLGMTEVPVHFFAAGKSALMRV